MNYYIKQSDEAKKITIKAMCSLKMTKGIDIDKKNINVKLQRKILSTSFNICFGCSKEPSQ